MAKSKKKSNKKAPIKLLLVLTAALGALFIWASYVSMDDYLKVEPAIDFCAENYQTAGEIKACTSTMFEAVDKDRQGAQALGISGAALLTGSVVALAVLPQRKR